MEYEFHIAERMAYAAFGSAVAIVTTTPWINTACFAAVTILFVVVGLIRKRLRHRHGLDVHR